MALTRSTATRALNIVQANTARVPVEFRSGRQFTNVRKCPNIRVGFLCTQLGSFNVFLVFPFRVSVSRLKSLSRLHASVLQKWALSNITESQGYVETGKTHYKLTVCESELEMYFGFLVQFLADNCPRTGGGRPFLYAETFGNKDLMQSTYANSVRKFAELRRCFDKKYVVSYELDIAAKYRATNRSYILTPADSFFNYRGVRPNYFPFLIGALAACNIRKQMRVRNITVSKVNTYSTLKRAIPRALRTKYSVGFAIRLLLHCFKNLQVRGRANALALDKQSVDNLLDNFKLAYENPVYQYRVELRTKH